MTEIDNFARTREATEKGSENWEGINRFHEQGKRDMIGAADGTAEQDPAYESPAAETSDGFAQRTARARRGLSK